MSAVSPRDGTHRTSQPIMVTIGTAARVCQTTGAPYAGSMLPQNLPLLTRDPFAFMMLLAAFAVSMFLGLAFHEFCHALVADRLGDGTPRRAGRLTLDPRAHLDPVGSLLILFAGFGWAKPTPVNPRLTRNPRLSMVLIAGAGPASNLLFAAVAGLPIKLGIIDLSGSVGLFFVTVVGLNVLLAVFNLLPLAPLDGFRVVVGLLPPRLGRELSRLEPWGIGILMALVFLPFLSGGRFSPISTLMDPPRDFFLRLFLLS